MPFPGEFVNSLCVGRGHVNQGVIAPGNYFILIRCAEHHPADPLQFLTQFLVCYRRFFAKQEPFRISEAIGGVMTPPYEVLRNSPTNESLNIPPRERTGQNEMRNEYHQTTSPEIVSGHRPPDKRKFEHSNPECLFLQLSPGCCIILSRNRFSLF